MRLFFFLLIFTGQSIGGEPNPQRQQELRTLLKHDCGACHGLTLKGGLGPALLPADLKEKPDDFLVKTILKGRTGTAMPPWERFINSDEAAWLIDQLKNPNE